MCSGVTMLLARRGAAHGWRLLLAHLGRITTYALLGALAGALGYSLTAMAGHGMPMGHTQAPLIPGLSRLQGIIALATAVLAGYMALALLGRAPSPERFFTRLTGRWGQTMRRLTTPVSKPTSAVGELATPLVLGLVWGLLPCGLVLTALLTAAVTGSLWRGAMAMVAFGLGTWPVLLGVGALARANINHRLRLSMPWLRHAAALVVLLFGTQMALRGFAAWGWVNHFHLGGVMVW